MINMSPNVILENVSEGKILRRLYSWHKTFDKMKEKMQWPQLEINEAILKHCVESYFCDLTRMKQFHEIEFADPHKRAGFTLKWIVKLRPVFFRNNIQVTKGLMLANEAFAVFVAFAHLPVDVSDIPDTFLRNLLYTMHYRSSDGEILSSLMFLLEDSLKLRNEINNQVQK